MLAVALPLMGVAVSLLLLPLTDVNSYPPLVAAVALVASYGGLRPALVAIGIGWFAALVLIAEPWGPVALEREELTRWVVPLVVAIAVTVLIVALQRSRDRAETSYSGAASLRDLAAALASAVEPRDVAHELVARMPGLLGASGGSLGLLDGDTLVIVDPEGADHQVLAPGLRLAATARAPITVAARTGTHAFANDRAEFERDYPDGARLAPASAGALAVPLMVGDEIVGAMGFPFARPGTIGDDTIALASVAADMGGRALERARRFADEQELRAGLDRVARLAPAVAGIELEAIPPAVCREARATFGADEVQLTTVSGDGLEIVWHEPPSSTVTPGTRVSTDGVPAVGARPALETVFVADALVAHVGSVREHVLPAGVRSLLTVPVAIGGEARGVLTLMWHRVLDEPSRTTLGLARRFGDQSGLALEQAARRRAQQTAEHNVAQTRRLLATTASFAAAVSLDEVAQATVDDAVRALGAVEATVIRDLGGGLEILAATSDVRRGEGIAPDSRVARAMSLGEVLLPGADGLPSLAAPLTAAGRTVGGLELVLPPERTLTPSDLDYVAALARQAGLAIERATSLEEEQTARRRAEQMAGDLAQLHALSSSLGAARSAEEVTRLVCARVSGIAGADSAGIYALRGMDRFELLESVGRQSAALQEHYGSVPLDAGRPLGDAVLGRRSIWLTDDQSWDGYPQELAWRAEGVSAAGIVPLLVEERPIGALFASFEGGRIPDESERRLVETMARLGAQSLDRVQLLERERAARVEAEESTRTSRVQQTVAERLAGAATPIDVGRIVVGEAARALGADAAVVYLVDQAAEAALLLADTGFDDEALAQWSTIPLRVSAPVTDVINSGEPLALATRDAILERYPYAAAGVHRTGEESSYCFPLRAAGRTLGAVYFAFVRPVAFTPEATAIARAILRQCAQALDRALLFQAERIARERTERLQSLTASLSGALTPDQVANAFLDEARAALGTDAAAFAVFDPDGGELRAAGWRGYADDAVDGWLQDPATMRVPTTSPLRVRQPTYHDESGEPDSKSPEVLVAMTRTGHRAFAVVPIDAGAAPLGVVVLSWVDRARLTRDERSFIEALAGQCGLALDRARQYESERTIAETLQRSVLPETLPSMQGVQVAVRYLPGSSALDVGGDWFDTLPMRDGRLGFVVGDVVGKGVRAAATMAQLRNGMRALTLDTISPAETVSKLNRLLGEYTDAPFATLAFITIDPVTHEASLVSAGHLPPLLLDGRGGASFLEGGRGLPLGVELDFEYESQALTLEAGNTVVLYTDGLIERRDRSIDEGLRLLGEAAAGAPSDPHALVETVVEALLEKGALGDDVAVLAVKLDDVLLRPFDVALPARPEVLVTLRKDLERWLALAAIPANDARDVVLAAWEASTNAIEHAQDASDAMVRVRVELIGDRLHVRVADSGHWKQPESRPDRGLGLRLMEELMTSVVVDRSDSGTTVVMERVLTRERVGGNGAGASHD